MCLATGFLLLNTKVRIQELCRICGVQINAHTSVPPSTLALICQLLKHSASDPYVFLWCTN